MGRWLPPVLAALLVAVLAAALLRPSGAPPSPLIGKSAPDFTLTTLDGQTFRLRDHLGGPVIVNFWASWCIPCREEAPLLGEFARAARNLTLVGVTFQDQPDAAQGFVREFAVPYPSVVDRQSRAAIDYGVAGIPETYFIDAGGVVREKHTGPFTREALWESARRIGVRF
ncbi:redoxin domain-containing protein (plasmid) [Deinococcus metallilatus]|uniref:Redoxin domain-containing protein n=1 Tax=Deinococcus metallilatus TaxID=1211322 RepID=A0AAJ5F6U3_9DEIO|nr:redoxin domain-containing protein [Deinococcus metallilatus]RXJ14918.1 redoxin domain-containing protein [Deinococcus metallilatus]TLK31039.1 redoxin domain-containing protein [Deinococcus metallilatus]